MNLNLNTNFFAHLLQLRGKRASRRGLLAGVTGLGLAARAGAVGAAQGDGAAQDTLCSPTMTLPDLAARWWTWATALDFAPVTESGPVRCDTGQDGDLWFLAGSLYDVGPVTRAGAIPPGKALFFPVASAFCAEPAAISKRQQQELHACAAAFINPFPPGDLTASLDGDPVPMTRAQTGLIPRHLEAVNPFGAPAGHYLEAADGYWVLLDPLAPGAHTIRFAAAPVLDVTYHLTVG